MVTKFLFTLENIEGAYKIPEDWNSSLLEDQKNVFWKRKLVLNIITDDGNG